jgi:UDP-N-acetylmuramate: L-alanyl-gamma-D-glutamyl-meso-diaminopimelate ligase
LESASGQAVASGWGVSKHDADGSSFDVLLDGEVAATVNWGQLGDHNVQNALVSIAAARHAGVPVEQSAAALQTFSGVKRRMEVRGQVGGITVYDDFAHHPTAIATTLLGLRRRVGAARILLVLEPRSNTMRMGVHKDTLANSMRGSSCIWLYEPAELDWSMAAVAETTGVPTCIRDSVQAIVDEVVREARAGDHILVMSNGSFDDIHAKLLLGLSHRQADST